MSLLVLGGARSGKSAFAQGQVEALAAARRLAPVFVATAHGFDAEMAARIAAHVAARDPGWRTIDAPYDLAATIAAQAGNGAGVLLIDCLTLWLSNIMLRGDDVDAATDELATLAAGLEAAVFVSNEVGAGIVPENALARRFRDAQGRLNQAMAAACRSVVLVTAGLPMVLKPAPEPTIRF